MHLHLARIRSGGDRPARPADSAPAEGTTAEAPRPERAPQENRRDHRRDGAQGERPPRDQRREDGGGRKPQGGDRPDRAERNDRGDRFKGGPKRDERRDSSPRTFTSGPDRKRDQIDPDNPFAALLALKDKT